jgi:hypothetical protein
MSCMPNAEVFHIEHITPDSCLPPKKNLPLFVIKHQAHFVVQLRAFLRKRIQLPSHRNYIAIDNTGFHAGWVVRRGRVSFSFGISIRTPSSSLTTAFFKW